jgi:hypothetical protein
MEFTMYQDVTIPAGATGASLNWLDRLQWNFTLGGVASLPRLYDVQVRDPATNGVIQTLFSFSTDTQAVNPTGDTGWQSRAADLAAFAGQTVRIAFHEQIPQVATGPGQAEFDGISLDIDVTEALAESAHAAGRQWLLGHVGGPDDVSDLFSATVGKGSLLEVRTYTPAAKSGEFVNTLDPVIRLYDADGNLVATDDDSASDRRNAVLKFKAPKGAEGTYFVEIASSDKSPTSGEYVLAVK